MDASDGWTDDDDVAGVDDDDDGWGAGEDKCDVARVVGARAAPMRARAMGGTRTRTRTRTVRIWTRTRTTRTTRRAMDGATRTR